MAATAICLERIFPRLKTREVKLDDLMVGEPLFQTRARIRDGGWDVLACVTGHSRPHTTRSFSRYDYGGAEGDPILSSTSAHREVNFHDQSGWLDFRLCE